MKQKVLNIFCALVGHNWHYKDHSDPIQENKMNYDFKLYRGCTRCNQNEYLNEKWKFISREKSDDSQGSVPTLKAI